MTHGFFGNMSASAGSNLPSDKTPIFMQPKGQHCALSSLGRKFLEQHSPAALQALDLNAFSGGTIRLQAQPPAEQTGAQRDALRQSLEDKRVSLTGGFFPGQGPLSAVDRFARPKAAERNPPTTASLSSSLSTNRGISPQAQQLLQMCCPNHLRALNRGGCSSQQPLAVQSQQPLAVQRTETDPLDGGRGASASGQDGGGHLPQGGDTLSLSPQQAPGSWGWHSPEEGFQADMSDLHSDSAPPPDHRAGEALEGRDQAPHPEHSGNVAFALRLESQQQAPLWIMNEIETGRTCKVPAFRGRGHEGPISGFTCPPTTQP